MRKAYSAGFTLACVVLIALAMGSYTAWAQDVTATITVTVMDASGGAVVGATVTAKSVERGTIFKAESNEAGIYRISQLPVGNYDLRVERQGFQTSLYPAFTLVLNQIARIDVQLKVGQVTETVEVTGAAPILKTEATLVDTIIDSKTNDALPLATRNYVELTLLSPGAVHPDPSSFNNGDNVASGARPFINGNREQANNFLLDGMDNNQVSDNLLGYTPAPDAIEEFNLITNNAPAEFGNFEGGVVSATIKSGTNSFHGDAWEFFRNDKLNANQWENKFNGNPRAKIRWNMFGSSLYPAAANTNFQSNAIFTTSAAQKVDQGDLKVDYKATDKDTISYRFTRAYQNNPSTNSQPLLGNGFGTTPIYNTVGDWTRLIGSSLVNDFRLGWSHVTLNSGNSFDSSVGQFGNTIGIGNGNPASVNRLLALNFSNSALSNLGQAEQTQSFDDHVWQVEDSIAWTHGRHVFKFGGQVWHETIKTFYAGNNGELGLMDFDGRFTNSSATNPAGNTGDGGADFVLGRPFQYGRGISTGQTWQQSSNIIGVYAQDTWKLTDRLALTLGLRYEAHTPWVEEHNQQANYNFATGNVDLAGQGGASKALYKGFYGGRDFQPRIGFAWTPEMLGGHTVVRGAFTVSSYLEGTGTNLRLTVNEPFVPAELNAIYNNTPLPGTTTSDGIVGSAAGASCAPPADACYAGAVLRVRDPKVQPAIPNHWNLP